MAYVARKYDSEFNFLRCAILGCWVKLMARNSFRQNRIRPLCNPKEGARDGRRRRFGGRGRHRRHAYERSYMEEEEDGGGKRRAARPPLRSRLPEWRRLRSVNLGDPETRMVIQSFMTTLVHVGLVTDFTGSCCRSILLGWAGWQL